jgi:hypothetical protein
MNTCPNGIELKLNPHSDGIRRNDRIKNTLEGCHLNRRRSSELPTTPSRLGNPSSCEDAISSSANVRFTGSPVRVNGLICHPQADSPRLRFYTYQFKLVQGTRQEPFLFQAVSTPRHPRITFKLASGHTVGPTNTLTVESQQQLHVHSNVDVSFF